VLKNLDGGRREMKNEHKWKRVPIKEELVALTGGLIRGVILHQFLYWSERTKDMDSFIQEEIERNIMQTDQEPIHGWIYKKLEELNEEIMACMSQHGLAAHVDELVKEGWLFRRRNPNFKWDKTYQYRVNLYKIEKDLQEIGYCLDGYKAQFTAITVSEIRTTENEIRKKDSVIRREKTEIRTTEIVPSNHENCGAIPEITTETTTDITTDITTENITETTRGRDDPSLFNSLLGIWERQYMMKLGKEAEPTEEELTLLNTLAENGVNEIDFQRRVKDYFAKKRPRYSLGNMMEAG
jgi:hypothetical protein